MSLTSNQQVIQAGLGAVVTKINDAMSSINGTLAQCTSLGATKTAADLQALKDAIDSAFAAVQADHEEVDDLSHVS